MDFLNDDFLLHTRTARALYHDVAKHLPIYDYHCHLSPKDVADNRVFKNLAEIWLEGDHYKWRAMRSNGVSEDLCTGNAEPYDKFLAWAKTVPQTLRNPLYHWTHLELRRYFGINTLLNEKTAPAIWEEANAKLRQPELSTHGILKKCRVAVVCTTDDPVDSLEHHKKIAASGIATRVYPTFRPDKALAVDRPDQFNPWCDQLATASGLDTGSFIAFLDAIRARHDYFHSLGGRLSDHGLEHAFATPCTDGEAARIFEKVRCGKPADLAEKHAFGTYLMLFFGRLDAEKGWTKQLHLGALRNNNTRLLKRVGADAGVDSIGDFPQAATLSRYLDTLDQRGHLPRTILYNLNPADNYVFATMIGNFQDGTIPGKIQYGSGWWFLDQLEGMRWQINALSSLGLLSRFVGMLTDSRSLLSYPRHEYFRRLLCQILGDDVERGELPADMALLGELVANVSYHNAARYFGLQVNAV